MLRQSRLVAVLLTITFALYFAFGAYAAVSGHFWLDEVIYLVKSWWYVQGTQRPYTDADATWYMPLYFYQLGYAQALFGQGHLVGRGLSVVVGGFSGILLFILCRKVTRNDVVSAVAVALYLLTPTTAYYFATATPIAAVSLLNIAAILVVALGIGNPRPGLSVALGAIVCALLFYRQNMILACALYLPAYIYLIGRDRWRHVLLLAGTVAIGSAAMLALFPGKLLLYFFRLPILAPILAHLSLLPESYRLILDSTESTYSLGFAPERLSWRDFLNVFVLPFSGTVALAAAALFLKGATRLHKMAAIGFFLLAIAHYIPSVGYCRACILTYTSYFVGLGAFAAGLTLAVIWNILERRAPHPAPLMAVIVVLAVGMNIFATFFMIADSSGSPSAYRTFPAPLVSRWDGMPENAFLERTVGFIAAQTSPADRILPLQGSQAIPYAIFRAGRQMPVPALNLRQSYRRLRSGLSDETRRDAVRALEAESFWTDETLVRWLAKEVDVVLYQEGVFELQPEALALLNDRYRLQAQIVYLGALLRVYVRRDEGGAPVAIPTP